MIGLLAERKTVLDCLVGLYSSKSIHLNQQAQDFTSSMVH